MDNKLKIGVGLGVAALIVAGGGYYCLSSDDKTPETALRSVEQSFVNHNRAEFNKFVNLNSILNYSYDSIVESLTDTEQTLPEEAKEPIKNITQIFKEPMIASIKSAIESYVETGATNADAGVMEVFGRTGITKVTYRGIESVQTVSDDEASAVIRVYHPDFAQDLTMNLDLSKDSSGNWQIVRISNFQDFVTRVNSIRYVQLSNYLEQSSEIMSRHDTTIREAEQKYASIMALGTVGQEDVYSDLRALMLDVVQKDWEARKQELFGLSVPAPAEALQNLRLKICDLEIGYAQDYVQWMEDKKATTIKSAEDKKAQARELSAEAAELFRALTEQAR